MSEKIIIDATSDGIALSTGAAEQAGVYIVASNPPPTVRQTPIGKPLISTLALMSPVLGCDFGFRGRPRTASLATPHGTAAALKAEAPQGRRLLDRVADADGKERNALIERTCKAIFSKAARKAANRRKARRGWR